MNDTTDHQAAENPRAIEGDNRPPIIVRLREDLPLLPDVLAWDHADLDAATSQALQKARTLPPQVTSAAIVADYATVAKAIKDVRARIEPTRKKEKQPFLDGGAAIDGFFKALDAKLEKTIDVLGKRTKAWQDAEDARIRREQQEAAEKAREAERARLAEAAALERAAQAARQEQERLRLAAEAAAKDDEFATAHTVDNTEAARLTEAAAQLVDQANLAAHDARVADRAVAAKPADNVRVRASDGALATSQRFWTHSIINLAEIPPAMLWPFISDQAKAQAVTAFVKAGNRELPGVHIFEDTKTNFR